MVYRNAEVLAFRVPREQLVCAECDLCAVRGAGVVKYSGISRGIGIQKGPSIRKRNEGERAYRQLHHGDANHLVEAAD